MCIGLYVIEEELGIGNCIVLYSYMWQMEMAELTADLDDYLCGIIVWVGL